MSKSWRDVAAPIIARVLEDTKDCTPEMRRFALRDAYPFGMRRYHPYKIWLDEIKRQTGKKKPAQFVKPVDPLQGGLFG